MAAWRHRKKMAAGKRKIMALSSAWAAGVAENGVAMASGNMRRGENSWHQRRIGSGLAARMAAGLGGGGGISCGGGVMA